LDCAKYLDTKQLQESIVFDPFWSNIIGICNDQFNNNNNSNNKAFFIYKDLLICKEIINKICVYKVVLLNLVAVDLVLQAHRHLNNCKGQKLNNQIDMTFEIRNLAVIIKFVTRECFTCALTAKQPCDKQRQSLPKNPSLVRNILEHWNYSF
jgi:hypothetical protein